jgi:2-keto-4-pentenoate hydratase/2-oxohepta-3-ene-1,7-dioic acid hydratase in catechol pathway
MRLIQYEHDGVRRVGVEVEGEVFDAGYDEMLALIRDGADGLARAREHVSRTRPVGQVRPLAPLSNPGKIFGSGVNYPGHGKENPGFVFPDEPVWDFVKVASAIIGPDDPIVLPRADKVIKRRQGDPARFSEHGFAVDYEVELGVVIGSRARNIPERDALPYIFGYTVFNDVGARSLQFHNGQRDVAKNLDTFCPMGPRIVTADELPDWRAIRVRSWVNGELRQDALVGEQICPPPAAIEWLSSVMTLHPGDCLMTGTPAGIGLFMTPPRFLEAGDTVTVAADGVGELVNPVVAEA